MERSGHGLPDNFYGTPPSGKEILSLLVKLHAAREGKEVKNIVFSSDLEKNKNNDNETA